MKRRIMSRSQILSIIATRETHTSKENETAMADMFCYMLEDGDEVKIYNDINMGGMVVETK